jgi:tRNA-uridine 2-sulfurtransferase
LASARVAVAMSGGVDSSVTAALLQRDGYDVFGIHLRLWPGDTRNEDLEHTCRLLAIPLHEIDFTAEFQHRVMDYFCAEYQGARTPNPCVVCNEEIKFGRLLDRAGEMGAMCLATGHYARIEGTGESFHLLRGTDRTKDQSYFLYRLGQRQLSRVLFPVGGLTKGRVRAMARELGLSAVDRKESQDICFIPGGDYRTFLKGRVDFRPGDIVDITGKTLGRHHGLALYTVGQRHGLGISAGVECYVLRLETEGNRLVVGDKAALSSRGLVASGLSWVAGYAPGEHGGITARVRYKATEVSVSFDLMGNTAEVYFEKPQTAVTPGQSVVFYRDEEVLGGGIIDAVL